MRKKRILREYLNRAAGMIFGYWILMFGSEGLRVPPLGWELRILHDPWETKETEQDREIKTNRN